MTSVIDFSQHAAYVRLASIQLGTWLDPQRSAVLANLDASTGEILQDMVNVNGIVVFTNYTGYDVELFVASQSPRWATRRFLSCIFKYAFEQLKVERATVRVLASNWKARNLVTRLGFVQEGVIRRGHAGENVFLYGMLKSECRWMREQKVDPQSAEGAGPVADPQRRGEVQPIQHDDAVRLV